MIRTLCVIITEKDILVVDTKADAADTIMKAAIAEAVATNKK